MDKEFNKQTIIELLESTGRKNIKRLIAYMVGSGYFEAVCSGGNHLSCEGGLAEHSLNVCRLMTALSNTLDKSVKDDSIIIVSILHDLGKMGDHGKPNYTPNILKSGKLSEAKPYETNKDLLYIPHEVRSIAIAERFIDLTEEEEHAIYYHNGKYTHIGYDLKETPLMMLLHFADLWASRVTEVQDGI